MVVFFFQAEDGIRDIGVTGVQTCALPISDILSYGMGEMSMLALARALQNGENWKDIRGLSYISKEPREDYLNLPSHAECLENKDIFTGAFHQFYFNCDPITAKGLCQRSEEHTSELQSRQYLVC